MTATNKLELELLQNAAANQTLANITFALLNQLVQAGVVDKDLAAPPASPADESLYIVGASATDAWAGRDGQLAYWLVTAGAWQFIKPKEGFFLHVNDEDVFYKFTGTAWEVFSGGGGGGGMTNPMTSIRDLIVGGTGGAATRLPGPTSEGMVLTRIGNALAWAIATGFANPMTTVGDIIFGGANGAATRLGAGTAGQVLTIVADAPAWVTPSGGGGGGDFKKDGSVQMTGALNEAPPVELGPTSAYRLPVASVGAKSNTIIVVAGEIPLISSMDPLPLGSRRQLIFTVPMSIANTATLILPTSDGIDARPGDTAEFVMYSASVWRMTRFDRFDGTPLKGAVDVTALDLAGTRKMTGPVNEANRVVVASQAVLSIGMLRANTIEITGTNEIASFGASANGVTRRLLFVGSLMISNNADTLRLPGSVDIQTRAGDTAEFLCLGGSSWQCLWYQRKDGTPVASAVTSVAGRTGVVTLTKSDVGLANADNTADADKPVSLAQQAALDAKLGSNAPVALSSFRVNRYDDGPGNSPLVTMYRARGTAASQSAVMNGDILGGMYYAGRDSAGGSPLTFAMVATAAEDFTSTGVGTSVTIQKTNSGSTSRSNIMQFGGNGQVTLNFGALMGAPMRLGQYTLTTLPSPSAYPGHLIEVTNATVAPAGRKTCQSNGTSWLILNTNTPVS
jgi:hypothetical protein